ncbi:tRNA (adenosine(37)-N6)-dimethylallyltransferase MiaA [Streptococcus sp. CSL10205-OR2]|uniref:tRNA (adenosine(37)-N6)-dimethylallyltransferase MiaA n=1 Tax=Streptococcus sp. CSL10205-OR2 TaxID=2980558 RepID=UPI0021DA5407|nr:tRNA (adenosine(37)-N6)-dimethylallyltransferase MiaA [Streptococcus sp. CSL10205-OR2]MCU9533162.1 tRNA (adenosine(37)-N6)-dimethylallyltransferase MiaA [Streptococcus sp. CSL10205-OR2]
MKTKIIVILGPTAIGKTALGIHLAKKYDGEIISGDSQQVYRHLNIGTAKVTKEEQEEAPHHLIDMVDVTDNYSVFDFVSEAKKAIDIIVEKGKVPIIVGGTGLYLQSLLEGYHLGGDMNQKEVNDYRKYLEDLSDELLFSLVEKEKLQIRELNRRRAIRSLEIAKFGKDLKNQPPQYDTLIIGLNDDREKLYERINYRVDKMMSEGILEEARWLYDNYPNSQATKGIGYKEFFPYFEGKISLEEAINQLKQNTRRFAKRQLTWFKNRMGITFFQVDEDSVFDIIDQNVKTFLSQKEAK